MDNCNKEMNMYKNCIENHNKFVVYMSKDNHTYDINWKLCDNFKKNLNLCINKPK